MFAAPASSFSCAASDNGLFLKFQPQLRNRLGLDQAATSSSFPSDSSFLRHPLEHSFQATQVQSLSCAADCARYGVHYRNRHSLLPQAPTHVLSLPRSGYAGLHHHPRHLRQHGLSIQAASLPSYLCPGACAGNGNLPQQKQDHLCLTLPSAFSCLLCGGGLLQQQSPPRLQVHSKQRLSLQGQQELLLRQQQKQETTKKHLADILESIAEHQESLKNSALASNNAQIDPNARGYLPPEFDISSCRSVFVGNIHHRVTSEFLGEVFSTVGSLAGCKLIKKLKSSYGIVEYSDHRAAAVAIATFNGRQLFGLPIKVNWAYFKEQREDKTGHHTIFVGDLDAEITDAALYELFSTYSSCSDVRVMWNARTGRPKGYGFVSFREREDAEKAIKEMTGKMLGTRAIRCNWATEAERVSKGQEATSKKGVKNDARFTTVYVGNLAQEVTEDELQKEFDMLGVGVIENVRIPKERKFGFVKYSTHEEAANAISVANGKIIGGKPVVCSWGTKPDPPEQSLESLPLAAPVLTIEEVLPHEEAKTEA